MTLKAIDIIEYLSSSDLYSSQFFEDDEENGFAIVPKHKKRLIRLVSQAVETIYRQYQVRMKSVWLILNCHQTEYLLAKQQPYLHRGYTEIDRSEQKSYPVDEYGIPIIPKRTHWDDDLKSVHSVYDICGKPLKINTQGSFYSVFLPRHNIIKVECPHLFRHLHIMYHCLSPKIVDENSDTELPEGLLNLVCCIVARNYYLTQASNEGMKRLQYYNQAIPQHVAEATNLGLFVTEEMVLNRAVIKGKWNR